jgi:hypothetical protein
LEDKCEQYFSIDEVGGSSNFVGLTLHFKDLLPDGSAPSASNKNLNSITFTGKSLYDFGASSLEQLNKQIANQINSHFLVGVVRDVYGDHGYVFIS